MKDKNGIKYSVTITDCTSSKAPVLLGGSITDCIKRAKQYGYDAVEMHYSEPSKIDLSETISALENEGLHASGIATGATYVVHKLSLSDASQKIREAAIQRMREYIDIAHALSAMLIIGCVRGNIGSNEDKEEVNRRLHESMKIVCKYAEEREVLVVIEAINRYENNYLNTAQETQAFIRESGIPNLKILLDSFHMNIEDADFAKSVRDVKGDIGLFHIADSNRWCPGDGHTDFKSIFDTLNDIGYDGYLSAECLPLPDGDTAAVKWREYFK